MAVAKFRSRARIIDLLGRQQIADVPTAVGELFKNALDAAARNVWIDFWKNENFLVIRDDGLGMRTKDVLDKWLILATESKYSRGGDIEEWMKFADNKQKSWMKQPSYGEKGIGRLSVATLGRMTLLWSVWGEGDEKIGTLCLVHWNLFQHPTKLFDDLPIPYLELRNPPTKKDMGMLFGVLRSSDEIKDMLSDDSWDVGLRTQLAQDIKYDYDTLFELVKFPWESGTTFCILEASEEAGELFVETTNENSDQLSDRSSDALKAYHAFSTFWDPFHVHSERQFKILPRASGKELIRTDRYWIHEDFQDCDHHIRVEVSADGFANGFIQNYKSAKRSYQKQLKALPKGYLSPGSFLIEIGYVQGQKENSFLPADIHDEMDKRLKHAGGFSIYINKVRVQPYGAIDSDFAGFEQRRLKNAGRYYFSMLRMFGGCFFPSKEQTPLKEKAGREGFIINGARKGLRYWLEDLFIDLADTYLGRKADREDKRVKQEAKARKNAKARIEREKESYIQNVRGYRGWLRDFNVRLKKEVIKAREFLNSETNASPGKFLDECNAAINLVKGLADELHKTPGNPPEGVVLEGDVLIGVEDYIAERERLINAVNKEIEDETGKLHFLALRARRNEDQQKDIINKINAAERRIREEVDEILAPVIEKARHMEAELIEFKEEKIKEVESFGREETGDALVADIMRDTSGELARKLERSIQKRLEFFEKQIAPSLRLLADNIRHLTDESSGSFILTEQAEEIQTLKERNAFLIEMAQLGLVFETANHEHEKHVSSVRDAVKFLKKHIDQKYQKTLEDLSLSFDIIDERIRMFDPLIRRRTAIHGDVSGGDIEEFIRSRFADFFEKDGFVEFTEAFLATIWHDVKRPIFLGAIHNIFHNALYWVAKARDGEHIRFSVTGKSLVISDSGPGVAAADLDRIFNPGFSRRPMGRGLGLYVAREALRGIGYELYCTSEPEIGALSGANFVITPKDEDAN